jgi:chemotaxis protein methyltransferase CheR
MPSGMMSISDHEFKLLRSLVHKRFGINFNEQKRSLVVGRLQKLLRSHSFLSFKQYYDYLRADDTGQALNALINQLSTNHTFFFRESTHFDFFCTKVLSEIVAMMKRDNCRDLRIWCAGCSSGEEPYTLAMVMLEYFGKEYGMWDAGILATDISTRALNTAISGVYPADKISNVPFALKNRYFIHRGNGEWAITEKVKKEITFRRFNLMNETFPFKKPFHVIFCRNVMIYFDQPTRDALIQRFYEQTVSGGYLFIGHSESIRRGNVPYEYVRPAVYRRN